MDDIFESKEDAAPPAPLAYNEPFEYAPVRLRRLLTNPGVRIELIVTIVLFAVMFLPHLWWWALRWTLPDSLQLYGLIVIPLVLAWMWLARWRLVIPELDWLNEQFTEKSVMRWLTEERHEEPKRLRWTLFLAVPFTLLALWSGEPMLTALAFVGFLTAYLGYRFGTQLLRVMAFPLSFLCLMTPLPGFLLDFISKRITPMTFRITTSLLAALGLQTEVLPEGTPIQIFANEEQKQLLYEIYAGRTGMGYPELLVFMVGVLWYLSLIEAGFARKLLTWLIGLAIFLMLIAVRLTIVGFLGAKLGDTLDGREWTNVFALISRIALPFLGWWIMSFVLRGFQCRTYHEWVRGR